jgi:hypothetical protein
VAFASPDVFPSVVVSLPARFGCLDALTVDDCTCWLGISVPIGALLLAQSPVDPAPRAIKTPFSVVIVNAVGIGKIVWEIFPLAASTENVQNRIDDFARLQFHRSASAAFLYRKKRTDQIPPRVGQIAGVAVAHGLFLLGVQRSFG